MKRYPACILSTCVVPWDERFTTVIAHEALRQGGRGSRQRRTQVDKAAAALILQGALDAERSTGEPAGELVASAPGAGG